MSAPESRKAVSRDSKPAVVDCARNCAITGTLINTPMAMENAAGLSQVPKHLPQVTLVEVTPKPTSIIAMYIVE